MEEPKEGVCGEFESNSSPYGSESLVLFEFEGLSDARSPYLCISYFPGLAYCGHGVSVWVRGGG